MFNSISIGIYYPGHSLLHRLQARTKLLLLLCIITSLIIADQNFWHFAPFVAVVALAVVGCALSNIAPREILRRMWLLLVLTIIGAFLTLFVRTRSNDKILYAFGPLAAPAGSIQIVLLVADIILLAIFLSLLLPTPFREASQRHRWVRSMLIPLFLLVLIISISLWLLRNTPATQTLFIGPLPVTYGGVWTFSSVTVILLALYTFSLLLTMTTSPVALIEGLTMLLAPLRLLHLPVDDFALMTLLALRFIPTLFEEMETLMKAQQARGADFLHGTVRERLQSITALVVPLIQGILRRASEVATALDARGYEVDGQQTRLYEKSLGAIDYLTLASVVLVMVGALLL